MPTVLITGGTGMIGTALSRHLLNEGYHVIILSGTPGKLLKGMTWELKGEFSDQVVIFSIPGGILML